MIFGTEAYAIIADQSASGDARGVGCIELKAEGSSDTDASSPKNSHPPTGAQEVGEGRGKSLKVVAVRL